jgi:hypothetical protein
MGRMVCSGREGSSHGRRTIWWSAVFCCLTFSCKMVWKTSGTGRLDPSKGYSIRGAYHLLSSAVQTGRLEYCDTVRHKAAPLKVSLLTWWLLLNRLPTMDYLIHREIIPQTSSLYSSSSPDGCY